jgi:hypothetical protein
MGVFAGQGQARTFDLQAGDVGYVPVGMGHYIENTSTGRCGSSKTFKSRYFVDFSGHVDGIDSAGTGGGALLSKLDDVSRTAEGQRR